MESEEHNQTDTDSITVENAGEAVQIPLIYMHSHHPTKPLENLCKDPNCTMNTQGKSTIASTYIPQNTGPTYQFQPDSRFNDSANTVNQLDRFLEDQKELLSRIKQINSYEYADVDVLSSVSQQHNRVASSLNKSIERRKEVPKPIDFTNFNFAISTGYSFYKFVNGSWLEKANIPSNCSSWNCYDELRSRFEPSTQDMVWDYIDKDYEETALREYYLSAMNEQLIENEKLNPVIDDLGLIDSIETLDEYFGLAGQFAEQFIMTSLFFVYKFPTTPKKDGDMEVVMLLQDGLGLPTRNYYIHDHKFGKVDGYKHYIEKLFLASGMSQADAKLDTELVFNFEVGLSEIMEPIENLCRHTGNNIKLSLIDLKRICKVVDWNVFFKNSGVSEEAQVVIEPKPYFTKLAGLVQQTPLSTLKKHMKLRYLTTAAPFLHKEMQIIHFEFHDKLLHGVQEMQERWKTAFQWVCDIHDLVNLQQLFSNNLSTHFYEEFDTLSEVMDKRFKSLSWISEESLQNAKKVISQFARGFGHKNYNSLSSLEGKIIHSNSPWTNYKLLAKMVVFPSSFYHRPTVKSQHQTISRILYNSIPMLFFPLFYDCPPFFYGRTNDKLLGEPAFNFGAFGCVHAREYLSIYHASYVRFNRKGGLVDWISEKERAHYEKQIETISQQIVAWSSTDLTLNVKLIASQLLADLGALSIAYEAFQEYKNIHGSKVKPSTYLYTVEQEFFISWARISRELVTKEHAEFDSETCYHAPRELRVDIPLSNMIEFHKAFSIKPGDRLYRPPHEIVSLW